MASSAISRVLNLPELLAAILDSMDTKAAQNAFGQSCISFWEPAMKKMWSSMDISLVLLSTMRAALATKRPASRLQARASKRITVSALSSTRIGTTKVN